MRVRQRQKIDHLGMFIINNLVIYLHVLDPSSVGLEDQLVGCATFMKLSRYIYI